MSEGEGAEGQAAEAAAGSGSAAGSTETGRPPDNKTVAQPQLVEDDKKPAGMFDLHHVKVVFK